MKLNSLTPNLMVKNVNDTLDFYQNTLDFQLLQTVPEEGSFDWAFVQKDDVLIMFQKDTSIREEYPELENYEQGGALTMYIKVADLQKWYENIKDKTNVIKPMNKTFYGANEFAIQDPNGFILTFSDILT
ncbi:VOC family protein [Fulvivirgaceae bacterium BMA12]|uniref:VOC family protein n=1 Tax=Agaribacillus aureus TaxID=3051825 RepID=A0ABT8LCH0_9BACT|nr:VOC family protein [Fulvivirgaceae bacterium BMA12]